MCNFNLKINFKMQRENPQQHHLGSVYQRIKQILTHREHGALLDRRLSRREGQPLSPSLPGPGPVCCSPWRLAPIGPGLSLRHVMQAGRHMVKAAHGERPKPANSIQAPLLHTDLPSDLEQAIPHF